MRARAPVIERVPRIVTDGKSAFFPLVYAKTSGVYSSSHDAFYCCRLHILRQISVRFVLQGIIIGNTVLYDNHNCQKTTPTIWFQSWEFLVL